jgi:acetolactate synthase small subunit
MPDEQHNKHWVLRVYLADRAGALTSIASALSNRGISIETIVGHGAAHTGSRDGTAITTFWCSEEEKDEIVRVVRRLSKVLSVEEHAYSSEDLRKSAIVRVTRKLTPRDVAGRETFLTYEPMGESGGHYTYFLAGSPSELDPVLARFGKEGILDDVVYSVVSL